MANLNVAYNNCIAICNDPNVGYSMDYREGLTINGITYYDCSSLMSKVCTDAGFFTKNPWFTTGTEESFLTSAGWVKGTAKQAWKKGDILWRAGHTEMVYKPADGGGYTMGAHTNAYQLSDQVSINTFVSPYSAWNSLFRFGGGALDGYSLYVIAAICGNFWQESTINPALWQGTIVGAAGYGLGQWTDNAATDRKTKLFSWLDENGYRRDDGNAQLQYLIIENVWYPSGVASEYKNLTEFLESKSTDLNLLTHQWMKGWEGISDDGTLSFRQAKSKECYDYIVAHASDSSITAWITGNRYLSDNERLNNAVMLYRYLAGDTPPEPPHPIGKKRKHMPIWMYPSIRRG